ncbi:MAG: iron donor protein CyaY [Myxococcales bacterium]|nr:iron donor protein CyaY [Myxococcales bacterium]
MAAPALLDERAFRDRAAAIYSAVVKRLDAEDPDVVEADMSAGVVKVRVGAPGERSQMFVLNIQPPLREVWYAAGDRAWHFRWDGARWIDPRNGDELAAVLGQTVSAAVGLVVEFAL